MSTKIKYSSARLQKLNSPYFCIYKVLVKVKTACVFFLQIFWYFPEKRHLRFHVLTSIWRVPTGLKIDHFHSIRMLHLLSAEKLQKQLIYYITFPCLNKPNYRKIGLIYLFCGEQKQSVLQRWVRRSVKRMVILTMCYISEFQNILDCNYIRIVLSIHVKFSLGK